MSFEVSVNIGTLNITLVQKKMDSTMKIVKTGKMKQVTSLFSESS